jgi:hypothetical protein
MRALLLVAAMLLVGCSTPGASRPASDSDRNRVLSQGYSQLYDAASSLRWLDEILLIKFESDETQKVITDVAKYATTLRGELEQLERDYPSLTLRDDGLPVLEKKKRSAQALDRAKTLAPVSGAHGADFERTLLLTQSGALNQLRFLAQVLVEEEKSEPRRKWMLEVQRNFDRLYVDVVKLLDQRHFRSPSKTPLGAAGAPR